MEERSRLTTQTSLDEGAVAPKQLPAIPCMCCEPRQTFLTGREYQAHRAGIKADRMKTPKAVEEDKDENDKGLER